MIGEEPVLTRLACANTSESITATGTHHAAALSMLTSTRHSSTSILQCRGFPAQESSTPTCHAPGAFIEEISDDQEDYIPSDDGPRDDGPDGVKSRSSPGQSLDEFWIKGMRTGEQRLA